ncbi:MAG: serine--tRNA ligase [Pelagibacteraceae bacterium]|nr:serine--tRNA ligase [Pelagibacteraceae bacterium]
MHNIKDIRKNFEVYKKKISERNSSVDLNLLMKFDEENRDLIQKKEKKEQEKKLLSKSKEPSNFELSKKLSIDINEISRLQNEIQNKIFNILSNIPNISHQDVPIGKDERSNEMMYNRGDIRKFDFKIKSHVDIGEINNQIDFKNSSKLSGSRFVVLNSNFALLERALINFMLDTHISKFSYKEISPPLLVNENIMFGTGQLPKFEEDQFEIKLNKDEERKFLIPTAEVVLTNLVRDTIIDAKILPLRYVAATPCFRKEAGSYGKDTKGLMRQHQFYKVELVSIVDPKNCISELDRMLNCAEEILKLLEIPYQVVLLSSGDMGFSAEKTFDIEVWVPSENKYREISSCSSCGSFQARRMNAKFKSNDSTDFLGTLNGSGLAVGRLMISLIENYQNVDGSVSIPNVLKKYMNNLDKI